MENVEIKINGEADALYRIEQFSIDLGSSVLVLKQWLESPDDVDNEDIEQQQRIFEKDEDSIHAVALFIENNKHIGLAGMCESLAQECTNTIKLFRENRKTFESPLGDLNHLKREMTYDNLWMILFNICQRLYSIDRRIKVLLAMDNRSNKQYPPIPATLRGFFPNEERCIAFVERYYGTPAAIVADGYLNEKGVTKPNSGNDVAVGAVLFNYFVKPFKPKNNEGKNEIYCDKSTFYKKLKKT